MAHRQRLGSCSTYLTRAGSCHRPLFLSTVISAPTSWKKLECWSIGVMLEVHPFSMLDFRFPIVGTKLRRKSVHSFVLPDFNPKSKIANPKFFTPNSLSSRLIVLLCPPAPALSVGS